ncbi:MAG: hypothetical protein L0271_19195 [Gemmatimonadetes bacterium]|nr:hypothetical protein [Gemmatimonadota bacterium]
MRSSPVLDAQLIRTIIACALLAACASGTDSPTDPRDDDDDGPGTTLTDAQRFATLEAVNARIDVLAGTDANSRRAELLSWLESRREFEDAGTNEDGSLWARFTDGRLLLIIANRDEFPEPAAAPATGAVGAAASRTPTVLTARALAPQLALATPPAELPASTQARVLGGGEPPNGPFMTVFLPALASMLTAGGYQIAETGAGTIDALLRVTGDDGVFYFGGHGGWGTNSAGDNVFGVTTATPLSASNDSTYKGLWLDSSLVYTVPLTPGLRPPFQRCPAPCLGYYAFTAKFVEKHMGRFSDGSVIYIGACSSFDAEFRQAFINKNAAVYFGWTAPFQANVDSEATLYLFDRLLGLNDPGVPQENPKQRPFDYVSVHNDMARPARGLTTSAGARLDYRPGNTESGLLAPSIKNMHVDEDSSLLVITGKFGSDPRSSGGGEVSINGSSTNQLQIKSWDKEQIVAQIPLSGPNSAGDVVVWNRGRRSNTRRLSQWRGFLPAPPISSPAAPSGAPWDFNLQFITGDGTRKWEGGVDLHFRVDLSSYRDAAGEPPRFRTIPFQIARDSHGELEASGTSSDGAEVWSGIARITTRLADPTAKNVVDGVGEIDTTSPFMRLALYITVLDGMIGTNPGFTYMIPAVWGSNDGPLSPLKPLPSLYLPLDTDFGIIGDQRRQVPTGPSSILYWSDIKPRYIPADTLAR